MATVDKYLSQLTYNVVSIAAIAEGDLVGINSGGTLNKADSDATHGATLTNKAIGVAVRGGASGATIAVAPIAVVSGLSGLTAGGPVYLDSTAGGYTATQPSTATWIVQPVGIALSTSSVAVNVAPAVLKVQAAGNSTVAFI